MRVRAQLVVLALALVLCTAVAGVFVAKAAGDRAEAATRAAQWSATPQPTPTASSVGVTVISDDYSVASQSGVPVQQWPAIVQRSLGVPIVSLSTAGSGYTTRPLTSAFGGTFAARAQQAASTSKVVLFMGGSNDQRTTRVALLRAASTAISSAQERAPDATVVVIGPISPEAEPSASLLAVRNALKEAASRGEARFVDPIAQGWLEDGTGYLAGDGRSLTEKGEQSLAARITSVLRPLL